jgi:tol-pal system protein YbgF
MKEEERMSDVGCRIAGARFAIRDPQSAIRLLGAALVMSASGCALRSDLTRVERQLAAQTAQRAAADSAIAANLASIARMVQSLYDTLATQQEGMTRLRGDLRVELFNVQQQLVAIQELTGQSQQRLTELRSQMDDRFQLLLAAAPPAPGDSRPAGQPTAPAQPNAPAAPPPAAPAPGAVAPAPGAAAPTPPRPAPPDPSADQLIDLSLTQLRRGSPSAARLGLAEFLRRFPGHARAVDAEFFTGEAWAAERRSDSAAAAYQRVVRQYPASARAAASMYKLGLTAAQAGRQDSARTWFNRVVAAFPNSEEAALAREQLRAQPATPPPATPSRPPTTPPRPRPPARS